MDHYTHPPSDASPPGLYSGKVIINGNIENKEFHIEKDYSVRVYPVTIDKTSLWVTNWFTIDAAQLKWMNRGVKILNLFSTTLGVHPETGKNDGGIQTELGQNFPTGFI